MYKFKGNIPSSTACIIDYPIVVSSTIRSYQSLQHYIIVVSLCILRNEQVSIGDPGKDKGLLLFSRTLTFDNKEIDLI